MIIHGIGKLNHAQPIHCCYLAIIHTFHHSAPRAGAVFVFQCFSDVIVGKTSCLPRQRRPRCLALDSGCQVGSILPWEYLTALRRADVLLGNSGLSPLRQACPGLQLRETAPTDVRRRAVLPLSTSPISQMPCNTTNHPQSLRLMWCDAGNGKDCDLTLFSESACF